MCKTFFKNWAHLWKSSCSVEYNQLLSFALLSLRYAFISFPALCHASLYLYPSVIVSTLNGEQLCNKVLSRFHLTYSCTTTWAFFFFLLRIKERARKGHHFQPHPSSQLLKLFPLFMSTSMSTSTLLNSSCSSVKIESVRCDGGNMQIFLVLI